MPTRISGTTGITFNDNSVQDAAAIGYNQTWQNVTASRSSGVTYTNSTGKPIQLMILTENNGNTSFDTGARYFINGVVVGQTYTNNNANTSGLFQAIIPNGSTYSVTASIIRSWFELR